jgi:DNA-binding MarR family transcriptional regulator
VTKWLSTEQQRDWRAWIAAGTLLRDQLSRELQQEHGLSLADYEILVRLSEIPDRRIRMSRLADATLASRSRLTHQVNRLEREGLVRREQCLDDRRGQLAIMTDAGFAALVAAAPTHVRGVREHLVDKLTPEEFAELGRASAAIRDGLAAEQEIDPDVVRPLS